MKKMKKMQKIIIIGLLVILLIALLLVILVVLFPNLFFALYVKILYNPKSHPELYIVPEQLVLHDLGYRSDAAEFSCFSLIFLSPWGPAEKEINNEGHNKYEFANGSTMIIWGPFEDDYDMLQDFEPKDRENALELYGEEFFSSPYHRDKILYCTSPADIRLNSSRKEITVSYVYLTLKAIKMPVYNIEDKFYYFDGKDIGCFIFQSPDQKRLAAYSALLRSSIPLLTDH